MPYIRSLDGLRGVAVMMVLLYHGSFGHFSGGFLGVDIFFVLSGFLITRVLQDEVRATGGIDWPRFYAHRAGRLLPALAIVLVFCFVLWRRFGADMSFASVLVPTVLYYSNWVMAVRGWFGPLGHVWSLSIEEQFYLVWPLCFLLLARTRRPLFYLGGIIAVFAASRAFLFAGGSVLGGYLSTLARADELLIGAFAAQLALVGRRNVTGVLSLFAAAAVLLSSVLADYHQAWLDYGGFTALAVLVAATLVHLSGPRQTGIVERVLEMRPIVAIGKISYGVYLFHLPLFKLLEPLGRPHSVASRASVLALQIAVTLAASWISYRLIEAPVRQWVRGLWLGKASAAVVA